MFEALAEKIVRRLRDRQIISKENEELYKYGFNIGLTILINLLSSVLVGVFFGMIFESMIFLMGYIPLRSYAGGYHARTPLRCYFISIFIMILILAFFSYVSLVSLYKMLLFIGVTVCIILSPVEDENKPLDDDEVRIYRKRSYIVLANEVCVWILLSFVQQRVGRIIPLIIFTESAMLIIGKIKNLSIMIKEH